MTKHRKVLAMAAAAALVLAACGDDDDSGAADTTAAATQPASTTAAGGAETTGGGSATTAAGGGAAEECTDLTPVKFQMQWYAQAQFAGYYAAKAKGFYEDHCLDVELLEGGVDIVPQNVLAAGGADFAVAWVPKALATREQGAQITDIAQIFQRSGTLQVAMADSGITDVADLKGKKVGNWGFGNEFEMFAGLTKGGLDPATDVELVQQDFNMNAFVKGDIDAAQAMTYNEYAQVLETVNPATGKLFTPDELSVINWNEVGTAMLQDAIWTDQGKLDDPDFRATAEALVQASIEGWIYCRDNPDECVDIVLAAGSQLGKSHQAWQMNEINRLIWPSPNGIGMVDEKDWQQTVDIAMNAQNLDGVTVITKEPTEGAYTNDLVEKALGALQAKDVDVTGGSWVPAKVTLNEGGQ